MEEQSDVEVPELRLVPDALSQEEVQGLPDAITNKLQAYFAKVNDSIVVFKAVCSSRIINAEQKAVAFESELLKLRQQYETDTARLSGIESELEDRRNEVKTLQDELVKLRESVARLEAESLDLRSQRDLAVDAQNNLQSTLDRRRTDYDRVEEEARQLRDQLQAALLAKSETDVLREELHARQISLEYKEKRLEQERELLTRQISDLTGDVSALQSELSNVRREHLTRAMKLESEVTQKNEELNVLNLKLEEVKINNSQLQSRVKAFTEQIAVYEEAEKQIRDTFAQQVESEKKVVKIYENMVEDERNKSAEIQKSFLDLQKLLAEVTEQYETEHNKLLMEEKAREEESARHKEVVDALRSELESANSLISSLRAETTESMLENLSPAAATMARCIRSGMSLPQLYSEYVNVSEQLLLAQEENRRLTDHLEEILKELEEKAPLFQKEREDHQLALENVATLRGQLDSLLAQSQGARMELEKECERANFLERENKRLHRQLVDLGRQVCHLLKEMGYRGGSPLSLRRSVPQPGNTADEVISNNLVTFGNIQELQENNQKLLALVRELTDKQEAMEKETLTEKRDIGELQSALERRVKELEAVRQSQEEQMNMIDTALKQRDLYRVKCEELEKSLAEAKQQKQTPSENMEELKKKLAETEKALKELTEENESYHKERRINDKMLTEDLEQAKNDLRALRQEQCKLVARSSVAEERLKVTQEYTQVYKSQISALEEKCKCYSDAVVKHEQTMVYLKDELLSTQSKLSRAEVRVSSLEQETRLLREAESRARHEAEVGARGQQSQAMLLANLEAIKATFSRIETEGRQQLEARLADAERECRALHKKMQEQRDTFQASVSKLQREADTARERLEEEKAAVVRVREELEKARQTAEERRKESEEQVERVRKSAQQSPATSQLQEMKQHVSALQSKLMHTQSELKSTHSQLMLEKKHSQQFKLMAEEAEKQVKELSEAREAYRQEMERRVEELTTKEQQLTAEILKLTTDLKETGQSTRGVEEKHLRELEELRKNVSSKEQELAEIRSRTDFNSEEGEKLREAARVAEEKYAHEVVLHSNDIQVMAVLKQQVSNLEQQLSTLHVQVQRAEEELSATRKAAEERERTMAEELSDTKSRISQLEEQNAILLRQLEELSSQIVAQKSQGPPAPQPPEGATADQVTSSSDLLEVIAFLRREKDVLSGKFEAQRAEVNSLSASVLTLEKKLKVAEEALAAEREHSEAASLEKIMQSDTMRKLETLNAMVDSNRLLREERDRLAQQVSELTARATKLEADLGPLKDLNTELNVRCETQMAENQVLRGETTRLRVRVAALVERSNKASPEDLRRLQGERDELARQLAAEKEAAAKVRAEKAALEEQLAAANKQHAAEVARLQQELSEVQTKLRQQSEELATITEDLGAKEALLADVRQKEQQIRKIAKKYKTQYEELKTAEEKAQLSTQTNEQLKEEGREEGRREVEQKMKEVETRHSDVVRGLNEQVTSSQEEAENLRKENSSLKSQAADKEDRTKKLLANARQKIMQLSEQKSQLTRQLTEAQGRIESFEQSKDEGSVRLTALKSQYEGRISRLEKEIAELQVERQTKERLSRELESATQRVCQLQRQLEKIQGSKPPTSSGMVEKTTVEPPTANIKPMAGPSSSGSKVQQTQQSVTVTPWPGRGETPFASIRPMSMQSRTVAVLPTSQTSSTVNQVPSSQSSAILVPPQQQLVHTTGSSAGTGPSEVLSSSPTSSHTDYMPATSTAGPIRQVLVQPQPAATVGPLEPPSATESEAEAGEQPQPAAVAPASQLAQQAQQQAAVALVLPRMEQASSQQQGPSEPPSGVASSSTVTTTQQAVKRPRDTEGDSSDLPKRARPDGALEVEYQVPTSSQRDQEDEIIVVDSEEDEEEEEEGIPDDEVNEEPDDEPEFEDASDGYIVGLEGYDGEGPDIDEENNPDQDNNEVEIIDDSSEVPSHSESIAAVPGDAPTVPVETSQPPEQQERPEATSSGPVGGGESGSVVTSQATPSMPTRGRPHGRSQQQLLLPQGYEDPGDDSIVPSTPTLFVPRRTDGFGEAVSSPHVPSGRFTFSETNPPTARAGVAQVASEGMDDTRMDLTQLEDSGTGRSVPTTPLQVSPQADESVVVEMSSEVGQSVGPEADQPEETAAAPSLGAIPAITVTQASEDVPDEASATEMQEADEQGEAPEASGDAEVKQDDVMGLMEDILSVAEESGDGVTSEGEKPQAVEEEEEGREAEATEVPTVSSAAVRRVSRGTARRSSRTGFRGRGRPLSRPTPIIWNEPGASSSSQGGPRGPDQPQQQGGPRPLMRGCPENMRSPYQRGMPRGRRMRGKPKGPFSAPYHMRF